MARGFGPTEGVDAADRLATALTASGALRSYGGWIWLTGAGGGGFGRLFARDPSVGAEDIVYADGGAGQLVFFRQWSTTLASWNWPAPSLEAWHALLVVYDGSTPAGVPVAYLDGASVVVSVGLQPGGGETLVDNSAAAMHLGNRPTGWTRHLNGRLEDWAVWGTLRSAGDAAILATGLRAGSACPDNLLEWVPLDDDPPFSRLLAQPSVTGTVFRASPPGMHYELPKAGVDLAGAAAQESLGQFHGLPSGEALGVRLEEAGAQAPVTESGIREIGVSRAP